MTHRTIKAYSKPARTISKKMMHGNIYTYDDGGEEVMFVITSDTDEQLINKAKAKCKSLELELFRVIAIGSKQTSFNTMATWCDNEIYRDDTRALYYEGSFDEKGNRIDQ